MKRFRGGLAVEAHRLCVSLNSRLDSNKEEAEEEVDFEAFEAISAGSLTNFAPEKS